MIAEAAAAFLQRPVQPFQVPADKLDAVIIINPAILFEAQFMLHAHAVFRNETARVTVVFPQIGQNVVNALLVDFPATVRVHFAPRHDIVIEEPFRHKRTFRVDHTVAALNTARLVIVDTE